MTVEVISIANFKHSLLFNKIFFKRDHSFVDIGALRVEILIMKVHICLYLQIEAFEFWPTLQMRCFF